MADKLVWLIEGSGPGQAFQIWHQVEAGLEGSAVELVVDDDSLLRQWKHPAKVTAKPDIIVVNLLSMVWGFADLARHVDEHVRKWCGEQCPDILVCCGHREPRRHVEGSYRFYMISPLDLADHLRKET